MCISILSSLFKGNHILNNIIFCERISATTYSYTTVIPFLMICRLDAQNIPCTITSTATVGYFMVNNASAFPTKLPSCGFNI